VRAWGAHLDSTTKVRRERTHVAELESSANPQAGKLRYVAHAFQRAGSGGFPAARRWYFQDAPDHWGVQFSMLTQRLCELFLGGHEPFRIHRRAISHAATEPLATRPAARLGRRPGRANGDPRRQC